MDTGSAIILTSSTETNITSISLTPGDWDVSAQIGWNMASAVYTVLLASISTVSETDNLATLGAAIRRVNQDGQSYTVTPIATIGPVRISTSAATTLYLVTRAVFSAGEMSSYGGIQARRVR